MLRVLSLLLLSLSAFAADKSDWTDLVGSDLTKNWATKGNWVLKDGVITLTPREGEKGWSRFDAYLWYTGNKDIKDFEIMFDYKVEKAGNSGFYFHVGDMVSPVKTGIEVQIMDHTGKLTDHTAGGVIPKVAPKKETTKPAGEWNQFHITVKGETLTIKLNGEVVNEVDLTKGDLGTRPKSGSIGFQDHGLPLQLKDIKFRALK